MKWRVVLETNAETGDWSVWCPELPGCVRLEKPKKKRSRIFVKQSNFISNPT